MMEIGPVETVARLAALSKSHLHAAMEHEIRVSNATMEIPSMAMDAARAAGSRSAAMDSSTTVEPRPASRPAPRSAPMDARFARLSAATAT
jgi:hypothetical protein